MLRGSNLTVSVLSSDPNIKLKNKRQNPTINNFMESHFFGNRLKRKDTTRYVSSRKSASVMFARKKIH